MRNSDRERKTQRLFYALILGLLVAYAGLKYRHISLAFIAYEGQVLNSNTSGAAK